MEQCCGKCKWLEQVHPSVIRRAACLYPLPFWIEPFYPYPNSGSDCKSYAPREEAGS